MWDKMLNVNEKIALVLVRITAGIKITFKNNIEY